MRPIWGKCIFQKKNISAVTFEIEIAKKLIKSCEYAPRIIQIIKAKKFSILRYTMQVYVTYIFRKFIFENSL